MSAQFLGFFLLCDSLIRSKSAQQNVVCVQLEEEVEMDGEYERERERGEGLELEVEVEELIGRSPQGQSSSRGWASVTQNSSPPDTTSWGFVLNGAHTHKYTRTHTHTHSCSFLFLHLQPFTFPLLCLCFFFPVLELTQTSPPPCTTWWTSWRSTSGTATRCPPAPAPAPLHSAHLLETKHQRAHLIAVVIRPALGGKCSLWIGDHYSAAPLRV